MAWLTVGVVYEMFPSAHLCLSVLESERVLQAVMAAAGVNPGLRATDCVTKVALSISCDNLLDMDAFSKSDPLCVLLINSSGSHWSEVSGFKALFLYTYTHISNYSVKI